MENPWLRALVLGFLFVALFMALCCATKKPECTFVCVDPSNIPDSCACAEEMIDDKNPQGEFHP